MPVLWEFVCSTVGSTDRGDRADTFDAMSKINRRIGSLAVVAVLGGLSPGLVQIAAAADGPPPPPHMKITASGGDGTAVDTDGTQGSFTNSVAGTTDSDGDQDARDMTLSENADQGQVKAPNKMTK